MVITVRQGGNFVGSEERPMQRYPSIDLGLCTYCLGCVEIAPKVFRFNPETSLMEVIDCNHYPVALVEEAIKNCPEKCISWVESPTRVG